MQRNKAVRSIVNGLKVIASQCHNIERNKEKKRPITKARAALQYTAAAMAIASYSSVKAVLPIIPLKHFMVEKSGPM